MMADSATKLRDLQAIDSRVAQAEKKIAKFDPLLEEVEEPVLVLEQEGTRLRDRLKELRLEEKRLESAAADKRARLERLGERLNQVRNLREEAAVHAETDMVKRAVEADESEAIQILDQMRRIEDRVTEVEEALEEARAHVAPRREELTREREEAERALAELRGARDACMDQLDDAPRRLYQSIRANGRPVAVAALTEDGACGHCYGFVPLQVQNEILSGAELLRCEGCGVILTAPVPPGEEPEEEVAEDEDVADVTGETPVEAASDEDEGAAVVEEG